MVRDMKEVKPIRQMMHEKKSSIKTPFSQRTGAHTAKYGQRSTSKDTFEEFMSKVKTEKQYDNIYSTKVRPYTSSG